MTHTRISWTTSRLGLQSVWSQVCKRHMHTASPFASHFRSFIALQESSMDAKVSPNQSALAGLTSEPKALDCTEWCEVEPSEVERILGVTCTRAKVRTSIMSDGTIRHECAVLKGDA